MNRQRRVVQTLGLSARTAEHTNSPQFHIIKVPSPQGRVSHPHLSAEFCIQRRLGSNGILWWTSYVLISRRGTLTRESGVYTEWSEFCTVVSQPACGIVAPRTDGILIVDSSKGVLDPPANGTVLRLVDLPALEDDLEIFAVLVVSGMHDGNYQVHGQSMLEYRVLDW